MAKKEPKKIVQINVSEHVPRIPWVEIKKMEVNNLKSGLDRDITKLENAIINRGFNFPFFLWANHSYIIDGAGRVAALSNMEQTGWVVPDLPVVEIYADSYEQAKKMVLQASSEHGFITQESFAAFVEDINLEDILSEISFPDVDTGVSMDDPDLDFENLPEARKERFDAAEQKQLVLFYESDVYDKLVEKLNMIMAAAQKESFSDTILMMADHYEVEIQD